MKEATARIKINKLLEKAGWRFFADSNGPANIQLEPNVTLTQQELTALGMDFEKAARGFIDFLLFDIHGFPLIVLEAKSEDQNPLVGKEQARKYARSQNCRYVILSNGNLHYFWDLERGNPYLITSFPSPESIASASRIVPDRARIVAERVAEDYVVLTQRPTYASEAAWISELERDGFIRKNKLRFLRPYQLRALRALIEAIKEGKDRFLFEMATGTGKTLTAAAVIKLFLRTANARRVLFLVDRLELEDQAWKAFVEYLKKFDGTNPTTRDPREAERRLLLDTYRTFGCEDSQPTFRYSLLDGVKDGYLINPIVVDARTDVTTQLLSDEGFIVETTDENGNTVEESYQQRQFEKKFFSPETNQLLCKTFLENALRDPVTREIGKSIIFAVSQNHAAKIAQILNEMADRMFPGKYQSDFAVQVTSSVDGAQQHTINFTNNKLLGSANFLDTYKTSKARVCVTVGMMTTGYDCPDILNLALMRPIFSPTDFIQIKGRGTRKHDFREDLFDEDLKATLAAPQKTAYKLFDFFANCEYFEEEFDYDQVIPLPKPKGEGEGDGGGGGPQPGDFHEYDGQDIIESIKEETIGHEGMRIDRMFYQRFEETLRENDFIAAAVEAGEWNRVIDYVNREVFDKPDEYYTLEKLRRAASVDRRLSLREILEKIFGLIPRFKSKDELLEEEFAKFIADQKPEEANVIPALKQFFKAYVTNGQVRDIIESKKYTELYTTSAFTTADLKAVPLKYRTLIPDYVKDYVSLNQFVA